MISATSHRARSRTDGCVVHGIGGVRARVCDWAGCYRQRGSHRDASPLATPGTGGSLHLGDSCSGTLRIALLAQPCPTLMRHVCCTQALWFKETPPHTHGYENRSFTVMKQNRVCLDVLALVRQPAAWVSHSPRPEALCCVWKRFDRMCCAGAVLMTP